jgi:UDP-N-acetylmuramate--alanine ligase
MRTESQALSRFAGRRIHFIGIGGSGMSGLARMLLDDGATISGSELRPNATSLDLGKRGAKISRDQTGSLLDREIDLVVRSAAVNDSNIELLAARSFGLPNVKYAELLGQVMQERFGVAVAGTHGKSTTTAMTAFALTRLGMDPSFVVGGTVPQLGGGSHSGTSRLFIAEACEFDRSFHHLRPRVAIITNIEEDHLDCYRDLGEIIESFRWFSRLVPADGTLIVNGQDPNTAEAIRDASAPVQTVALDADATWRTNIIGSEQGCYIGRVHHDGVFVAELRLSVAGKHNLHNATAALAACVACGADVAAAARALGEFAGVDRRMTEVGRYNGAIVVDDYGHHPTEIRATLSALRGRYNPKRLVCIFQPHQHSRTRFLLEDFAASFAEADEVIVPDIYFVRDSEVERGRVSAIDLVDRIVQNGQRARHLSHFDQITSYLKAAAEPGDLIVTMGAGNVWEIGHSLIGEQ